MHPRELPPELTDRRFEIIVRRLADDLNYGQDASPFVGGGVDYVQSRPFVEGDPVRDIDWRVSARTGRYHVKEYEVVKSMPIYIVLDTSASMTFSSTPLSKYALSVLLAGGLGLAALRRMSPVGLLGGGDRRLHFRPALAMPRIFQWLHELRLHRYDESTRMAQRLDELCGLLKSRCLIVVLSDLHDADALSVVKRVAQQHDCIVIQPEDPAERGRLKGGFIRGLEAETGRQFVAHGRTKWFAPDAHPAAVLPASGVDHLLLPTDRPFIPALRRFLADRGGLVRAPR